jgi:phosphatidate cytidylyltransferase
MVTLFALGLTPILIFSKGNLIKAWRGEIGKRYISWVVMAPLFLVGAFVGGFVGGALLLLLIWQLLREYRRVVGVEKKYYIFLLVFIFITFIIAASRPYLFFALPAATILALTAIPILTQDVGDLYNQMSYAFRGYIYTIWPLSHLILMRQLDYGLQLMLITGVGVALADACAFTIGKLIGKHKISPKVSPNKAYEGVLGDLLGAAIAVLLFSFAIPSTFTSLQILGLILIIGIGSSWGDLTSSLVKRSSGVKDWGELIPGHGGLMDRLNSAVVVFPLVYYFAILIGLW